jgi:hypothetical protein
MNTLKVDSKKTEKTKSGKLATFFSIATISFYILWKIFSAKEKNKNNLK